MPEGGILYLMKAENKAPPQSGGVSDQVFTYSLLNSK